MRRRLFSNFFLAQNIPQVRLYQITYRNWCARDRKWLKIEVESGRLPKKWPSRPLWPRDVDFFRPFFSLKMFFRLASIRKLLETDALGVMRGWNRVVSHFTHPISHRREMGHFLMALFPRRVKRDPNTLFAPKLPFSRRMAQNAPWDVPFLTDLRPC